MDNAILETNYKTLPHERQLIFDILINEQDMLAKKEWMHNFANNVGTKKNNTTTFTNLEDALEYGEVLFEYQELFKEQKQAAMELHSEYHFPVQVYVQVDDFYYVVLQPQVQPNGTTEIVPYVRNTDGMKEEPSRPRIQ